MEDLEKVQDDNIYRQGGPLQLGDHIWIVFRAIRCGNPSNGYWWEHRAYRADKFHPATHQVAAVLGYIPAPRIGGAYYINAVAL